MVYTDKSVRDRINRAGLAESRLWRLLPEFLRSSGDPAQALKGYFGAVQQEYDRAKDAVEGLLSLIDPTEINNRFVLSGYLSFVNAPQWLVHYPGTANSIVFDALASGVDQAYVGFGVYIAHDDNGVITGQYRRVIAYQGSTRTATVDYPFTAAPSRGTTILCYPDRVWLPVPIVADPRNVVEGTLLPQQPLLQTQPTLGGGGILPTGQTTPVGSSTSQGTSTQPTIGQVTPPQFQPDVFNVVLPNTSYISDRNNYYVGWTLEFLDGPLQNQPRRVAAYSGLERRITVEQPYEGGYSPQKGMWFRLSAPNLASTQDDFYRGMWLRITSGPSNGAPQYNRDVQVRRIVRSVFDPLAVPAGHICFVADAATGEGEPFELPPDPTSTFGIARHHVPLDRLAEQIGWRLDSADPEELQREQIRQAISFYKLKGTARAIEVICRTLGLEPSIEELASNYARPAPRYNPYSPVPDVGPGSYNTSYITKSWPEINAPTEIGVGDFTVPSAWLSAGRDAAAVPNSDINVWVRRINNRTQFDTATFQRLLARLEEVRPVHIEIRNIGLMERFAATLGLTADCSMELSVGSAAPVELTADLAVTLLDAVLAFTGDIELNLGLTVSSPARYDRGHRFDERTVGTLRFDLGRLYHQST